MYIERAAHTRLSELLGAFPAVVVTGARQVGKSTLLGHHFRRKADFVVLDAAIDVENARQEPELFLENQPWFKNPRVRVTHGIRSRL